MKTVQGGLMTSPKTNWSQCKEIGLSVKAALPYKDTLTNFQIAVLKKHQLMWTVPHRRRIFTLSTNGESIQQHCYSVGSCCKDECKSTAPHVQWGEEEWWHLKNCRHFWHMLTFWLRKNSQWKWSWWDDTAVQNIIPACLMFAKDHLDVPQQYWQNILSTD